MARGDVGYASLVVAALCFPVALYLLVNYSHHFRHHVAKYSAALLSTCLVSICFYTLFTGEYLIYSIMAVASSPQDFGRAHCVLKIFPGPAYLTGKATMFLFFIFR